MEISGFKIKFQADDNTHARALLSLWKPCILHGIGSNFQHQKLLQEDIRDLRRGYAKGGGV